MPIRADEMPAVAAFYCPQCDETFIATAKDYVPLKVRERDFDILAFCPICGDICGTTVNKINRKESI